MRCLLYIPHMSPGNSGSRTDMCPDCPSVKPLRAKKRKIADMCTRMCRRCSVKLGNVGMPSTFVVSQCSLSP